MMASKKCLASLITIFEVYLFIFFFFSLFFFPCRGVSSNDFPCLENLCKKIIKEKQPFERLEIKKETLLEMFKVRTLPLTRGKRDPRKGNGTMPPERSAPVMCVLLCHPQYNKFKCRILNEKVTTPTTTVYR